MNRPKTPVVLALSGHDPTGGAGVQADIEATAAAGCRCVSVITCLTAQNTAVFKAPAAQPAAQFQEQLRLLAEDIAIDACKIGMVGDAELIAVIAEFLEEADFPVVLDPVLSAGAGGWQAPPQLVRETARRLLPRAAVATPNRAEALALTGCDAVEDAARALLDLGCGAALVTDADDGAAEVVNAYLDETRTFHHYRRERLPGAFHGSGCTLAAHLAARLAQGDEMRAAVEAAQEYTWRTLKNAQRLGKSQLHPGRLCP